MDRNRENIDEENVDKNTAESEMNKEQEEKQKENLCEDNSCVDENKKAKKKLRCGHETVNGKPCMMPAGWGTSHPGVGYCAHHDFQSTGMTKESYPPLLDMLEPGMRDYVMRMLETDTELSDFSKELAAYKVQYFNALNDPENADYDTITRMLRAIAYGASRLDEIKHGKHVYIHVNVLNLVLQAVGETARQYLPADRRAAFSKDLRSSVQRLLPQSTSKGIAASAITSHVKEVIDIDDYD